MSMVRFDPFRDLAELQDRVHQLFNELSPVREDDLVRQGTWRPPVDIYEDGGELVLNVELPGMRREDIDVSIENRTLTIRGERTLNGEVKKENFHRIERAYGSFRRSFSLPDSVDPAKISAEYRNGVLSVKLPMREEARPRTIDIQVAA